MQRPQSLNKQFINAATRGDLDAVRELLQNPGVDPMTLASDGYRALSWASMKGHFKIVQLLLLDPRVDPAADDNSALAVASENGYVEIVQLLLLDPRVDPTADDNQALKGASAKGRAEVVRLLLLDPRVDPAANDNYALCQASRLGHVEVVRLLLLDPRVDPTARNNFAIRWASENGHVEVVQLLLADFRVSKGDFTTGPQFGIARRLLGESRMRLLQLTHQIGYHSVLPSSIIQLVIEFAGEPYVTPEELEKLVAFFTKIRDRRKTATFPSLSFVDEAYA